MTAIVLQRTKIHCDAMQLHGELLRIINFYAIEILSTSWTDVFLPIIILSLTVVTLIMLFSCYNSSHVDVKIIVWLMHKLFLHGMCVK